MLPELLLCVARRRGGIGEGNRASFSRDIRTYVCEWCAQVLLGPSAKKAVVMGNIFAGAKRIKAQNASMRISVGLNVFDED